jgi:glycosyltransferase involved in cell wall biosynthesis
MKSKFITVVAIAYNESKHCERFMQSAKEADAVVVLDTGSTDNTPELLRKLGARVEVKAFAQWKTIEEYEKNANPWRFDTARNLAETFIPEETDICVALDLDEVITPGWADKLRKLWKDDTEQAYYDYVWNHNPDGSPGVIIRKEKIYNPNVFVWRHPVHEVTSYIGDNEYPITIVIPPETFVIEHFADNDKPRTSYLPLLELSVKEVPDDDRNAHYYGRELMFRGRWQDAITELKRHLSLPRATWKEERSASMRFIGACYESLGSPDNALVWYKRAVEEKPSSREAHYAVMMCLFNSGAIKDAAEYTKSMLAIKRGTGSYIHDVNAWGVNSYINATLILYKADLKKDALSAALEAVRLFPDDRTAQYNWRVIVTELLLEQETVCAEPEEYAQTERITQ